MISTTRPPEPFPWLCPRCGQASINPIVTAYETAKKHEGVTYEFAASNVEVYQCGECGEQLFDSQAGDQIQAAFRAKLGLLQPGEIREGRSKLGLSQAEFAARLRLNEESLSRWETGALLQPRHADTLIRLYFASPRLRGYLDTVGASPDFGRSVCYDEPATDGNEAKMPAESTPSAV